MSERDVTDAGNDSAASEPVDFLRTLIKKDNEAGKYGGRVHTRFPPEPNGFLHIGHAKSICLNFTIAAEFGGKCNLRFDDTNPEAEDVAFVDSIQNDIRWLGFDWEDRLFFASDYYQRYYDYAVELVNAGRAYVCSLSEDEIREYRGTVKEAGKNSPDRDRTVEENLDLLERMKAGEFADGAHTLRAKIDMASANMKMRDPLIYRIRNGAHHYRTGDQWKIYPMYDFAHCLGDSIEEVTHSFCTLEFENNRDIYDWVLDQLGVAERPYQTEFARLNLAYTVLSKRHLKALVEEGYVSGWDDPRMPTLAGLRRRGYTPEAVRKFCDTVGIAKRNSLVDMAQLDFCAREHLNATAPRVMAVLRPLKLVIDNYPEGKVEDVEAMNNPEDESAGSRTMPFSRVLYIEREDFMEDPPKKFFRLAPGREVRLKHAYFVKCERVVKDDAGEIIELGCTYDPETGGGSAPDKRRPKATLHWVSAEHAVSAEVRLYDRLFKTPIPGDETGDFRDDLNPDSLEVVSGCRVEPALASAEPGTRYQFLRHGYFVVDSDSGDAGLVFNKTVGLRDSWAKVQRNS